MEQPRSVEDAVVVLQSDSEPAYARIAALRYTMKRDAMPYMKLLTLSSCCYITCSSFHIFTSGICARMSPQVPTSLIATQSPRLID